MAIRMGFPFSHLVFFLATIHEEGFYCSINDVLCFRLTCFFELGFMHVIWGYIMTGG